MLAEKIRDLRVGRAFSAVVKDPNRTEKIFEVADLMLRTATPEKTGPIVAHALSAEGFRALYERRFGAPHVDLDALARLPEGTLGREYARHMRVNGLDADFYTPVEVKNEVTYLALRMRQVHDIWHVVTGYGTGVADELALQGFTLAQVRAPISAMILAGGLLHTLRVDTGNINAVFEGILDGYHRGKASRSLLGVPFEELWEVPVEKLRTDLSVPSA